QGENPGLGREAAGDGRLSREAARETVTVEPLSPASTGVGRQSWSRKVQTLTDNVLALAATVRDINGGRGSRPSLDVPEEAPAPEALDRKPEAPGGADALPAPKRGKGKPAA